MNSHIEYCPNCITKLHKKHLKLGKISNWLKCPNCGFITKPKNKYEKIEEYKNIDLYIENTLKHNTFHTNE